MVAFPKFEEWLARACREEREGATCLFHGAKGDIEAVLIRQPSRLGWIWSVALTFHPARGGQAMSGMIALQGS